MRTLNRKDAAPPASAPGGPAPLTLAADAAGFKALAAHPLAGGPARLRRSALATVVYDTEAADLARNGLALQMRSTGARHALILTTPDGVVEATSPDETLRLELLPPPARARVADAAGARPLRPVCSWRLRRATRRLVHEGATVEIAFEEGEIAAEAGKAPLREIALTLKAGAPAGLYRLALALTDVAPMRFVAASRLARARALTRRAGSARAAPSGLAAEASLDAAIGALLSENLRHFLGNWQAVEAGDTGEAVHQLRVALRRLRSLLALLRRAFPLNEIESLRAEAKRIADSFGAARDWRVFADMVAAGPAPRFAHAPGLPALTALAGTRSEAGRAAGAAALAERATTRFVLALNLFIRTHGWRNAGGEPQLRALGAPASAFAAEAMERLFRRVRKRARGFAELTPEARHDLRIALKHLRYAVDFFAPLFAPAEDVVSFAEKASRLQDQLGAANDAAVVHHLLSTVDLGQDAALAFAAGAAAGWSERGAALDEAELRKGWKRLRKAKRFWRDALPEPDETAPTPDA